MNDELPDDWSAEQAALFMKLYKHMVACPLMFVHPVAPPVAAEHWDTTAYNAAWAAAMALDNDTQAIHIDEDGNILDVEPAAGETQA